MRVWNNGKKMQREKSNLRSHVEHRTRRDSQKSLSSSFNPPLFERAKTPLPAIGSHNKVAPHLPIGLPETNGISTINYPENEEAELVLPTRIFQAKIISVKDLSQGLCSYLWFRRIKEIFLVMGKQNDAFTRFDMDLARADMLQTCAQYLESKRPKMGGLQLVGEERLLTAANDFPLFLCLERRKASWSRSMEE